MSGASARGWQSAVTGIAEVTCSSRMRSTLTARRLAMSLESALFIALNPIRNDMTIPTESRLIRVIAMSNSMSVKPASRFLAGGLVTCQLPQRHRPAS